MEWTKRHNLNRGYMRLEVWNDSVNLYKTALDLLDRTHGIDIRLRSQILDSVQSISANIAEGYCRKSIKEYIQFLYVALGSAGESLTRMITLKHSGQLSRDAFEEFDTLQYASENKLLGLVRSLQNKAKSGNWNELIDSAHMEHIP